MHIRLAAFAFGLLWLVGGASAQSVEPKQKAPNEAAVILQDSKKKDPALVAGRVGQSGAQS